jgi:hypothetical protein
VMCVSLSVCVCAYSDLCDVCVSMYTQIKKKRFFLCDVCVSLYVCVYVYVCSDQEDQRVCKSMHVCVY